jgi:hypothetical protein
MPGTEINGRSIGRRLCATVPNASERLWKTLMEKSPFLTFKRTLTSHRVKNRLNMGQKRKKLMRCHLSSS